MAIAVSELEETLFGYYKSWLLKQAPIPYTRLVVFCGLARKNQHNIRLVSNGMLQCFDSAIRAATFVVRMFKTRVMFFVKVNEGNDLLIQTKHLTSAP